MGMPIFNYAVSVSTNIAICTLIAPLPYQGTGAGMIAPAPNKVASCPQIDLVEYIITAGSTGVGTIVTFQVLQANSSPSTPVWFSVVSPAPVTLANSTNYNGVLTGPFNGVQMLISSATGNGISFAQLNATLRDK